MGLQSVLEINTQGAWNGGTLVDNSTYAARGMRFKGDIPVTDESIQARIGIRTRMAAPANERIGVLALQNLLASEKVDRSRVKVVIGATNMGEDLYDPGPLIKYPYALLAQECPEAIVFDLYAGCPGFNVATELLYMLSLSGVLKRGDLAIIVGAENIHRSEPFNFDDPSNIIFGDDAVATLMETKATLAPRGQYEIQRLCGDVKGPDFPGEIARQIHAWIGNLPLDGIIIDNNIGQVLYRVPALAARVQHRLAALNYPELASQNISGRFREAIGFYERHIDSFAYDIMALDPRRTRVHDMAKAYITSGYYHTMLSVRVRPGSTPGDDLDMALHRGEGFDQPRPQYGIVDVRTRTHGCFSEFIRAEPQGDGRMVGYMNGKGVFLYATRSAGNQLKTLLARNDLDVTDIDLLIEHQANFAMIPMTLDQVLPGKGKAKKAAVAEFLANKMVTNIHTRGNCSVVCMQRLPYDLKRGVLEPDTIQGFRVNDNLEQLQQARLILNDSVGAGMLRSSFLQRLPPDVAYNW